MAIITDFSHVKEIYAQAAEKKWVIPCFCSENLTTTEAVLSAAQEFAEQRGLPSVPVTLAITVQYGQRPQSRHYTHTRRWDTGLNLFRADAGVLAGPGGPFPNVDVLIHLDHVQHDLDAELLDSDLSAYSSIMYDASALPFEENIRKTTAFTEKMKGRILIEGACDEIFDAGGSVHNALTAPEDALRYYGETGADLVVANLGTEHRASAQELHYAGDAARKIRDLIGTRIVLHGLSSVPQDQVRGIFGDGICKVNIWTMLERDSSPVLMREMVRNAVKAGGPAAVDGLIAEDLLTEKTRESSQASISHFATMWRQDIVFMEMKKMVRSFLDMWYL
ncbi:MAG: class II fructose-bisphosphate aldolase [Clostridiales bacterium]|nr:class II fructose-bisphosphate aldolase [Clostridiales bacterium]